MPAAPPPPSSPYPVRPVAAGFSAASCASRQRRAASTTSRNFACSREKGLHARIWYASGALRSPSFQTYRASSAARRCSKAVISRFGHQHVPCPITSYAVISLTRGVGHDGRVTFDLQEDWFGRRVLSSCAPSTGASAILPHGTVSDADERGMTSNETAATNGTKHDLTDEPHRRWQQSEQYKPPTLTNAITTKEPGPAAWMDGTAARAHVLDIDCIARDSSALIAMCSAPWYPNRRFTLGIRRIEEQEHNDDRANHALDEHRRDRLRPVVQDLMTQQRHTDEQREREHQQQYGCYRVLDSSYCCGGGRGVERVGYDPRLPCI